MTIRAATDVGGTFTDLVYFSTDPATGEQSIVTAKADTTPPDFERGVLDVMAQGRCAVRADRLRCPRDDRRDQRADRAQGRHDRADHDRGLPRLARDRAGQPARLLQPALRQAPAVRAAPPAARGSGPARPPTAGARAARPGASCRRSSTTSAPRASRRWRSACCTPTPIRRTSRRPSRASGELWPEVSAVASHQITREWREYERTSTAVLSAYVQPVAERYLGAARGRRARPRLRRAALRHAVELRRRLGRAVEGDPDHDGGVGPRQRFLGRRRAGPADRRAQRARARHRRHDREVLADRGRAVSVISDYWIERSRRSAGYPIMVPVVDLVEIGNGGGSIAWVDDFGKLHVGPQSAGASRARPRTAAAATTATTTDANLALGRINPDYFCGGEIEADMDAVDGERCDAVARRPRRSSRSKPPAASCASPTTTWSTR